jgi:very-short-patch-repair endonuclease
MPVGPFIADFGCSADRIVIELDGSQHANSPSDRRRDAFFRTAGGFFDSGTAT